MKYEDFTFKIPIEDKDYKSNSKFIIKKIGLILDKAIFDDKNKIIINTNLKLGLPMENINKIAGPFIEAWAFEIFSNISNDYVNEYYLEKVETKTRLHMADVVLQFRKSTSKVIANVDVKATSENIFNSGKSPNITSYSRIRTAYVNDPDFMFIILSLKHKVYSIRSEVLGLMNGVMEVVSHNAYDLKYISDKDISYNPALGSGQLQIKDIHYVTEEDRNVWEFCQLLDYKYLNSSKRTINNWKDEAIKNGWIK